MSGAGGGGTVERLKAALEGRYRVERELGEGGMATVYLAHDERHDRSVALKVLRPELAAVVGGDRFLAEIRTTANLQHPHILPLYDSGEADSFLFYVMPYVEGETLRGRLDREGQLPVDEAVRIARAVAGGLDYAHRQGVVHRDIKPANILLQDGEPVIADFGIALAIQQAGGGRLTETGLSLGTPYYMSPEQATAERDPDARSDVYSLGCVLYEMLTGEPPFPGNTAQAVLGKILTAEPIPPSGLRKTVPPGVEAATLRALARVPADRFGSAAEFARALAEPERAAMRAGAPSPRASGPNRRRRARVPAWLPWVVTGVTVVAALAVVLGAGPRLRSAPPASRVVRASLQLPSGAAVSGARVAISADGSMVAVGATVDGRRVLMARPLDRDRFTAIEGTEGGDNQFLSPDGRSVGFHAGAGMRRAPTAGGQPVTLDPRVSWSGGDWGEDGTIVYSRSYQSGLWRLRPGGEPEQLTEPAEDELAHWWPQLLPDGEHVLFSAFRTPIERARLTVLSLETGERKDILSGAVHGRYVETGHLLFARGEAIYAVPFDAASLEVRGEPTLVVDDVAMFHEAGLAAYDVSRDGTLVYVPASEANAPSDLVWVDREGREEPTPTGPGRYAQPELSPDGRALAVAISSPGAAADIWVFDLERGTRSLLGAGGGIDFQPTWTPDGGRIIYASESPVFDLYWRAADGSAPATPLVASDYDKYPGTFTPDGDTLYFGLAGAVHRELWKVALAEGAEPVQVFAPDFDVREPAISPDGRWIAYTSAESGSGQVYLSSFPDLARVRRQVSTAGGVSPAWTKGGRELVYMEGAGMVAVAVDPATGVLGRPETLFEGDYVQASLQETRNYAVTPDGERFLVVRRPAERAPRRVVVVTGFFEELRTLNDGGAQ